MSLASPVWQKFIFPPFGPTVQPVEGVSQGGTAGETRNLRQQPVEQIDFREDDPEALRILLRIAHLKFRDIPSQLSYKTLLNIAILCDQYDCVDLVVSFLPQWLSNEEVESKKPGQVNWLFIAWVFGRRKVFEELSKHLIRNLSIGEDDEYYISGARVDEPLPAEILGTFHTSALRAHSGANANDKIRKYYGGSRQDGDLAARHLLLENQLL